MTGKLFLILLNLNFKFIHVRNISILAALAFICLYIAFRKIFHPVRKENKTITKHKKGHK